MDAPCTDKLYELHPRGITLAHTKSASLAVFSWDIRDSLDRSKEMHNS